MRPFRETIAVEDAKALALEAASPVDRSERIALRDATGRVLATSAASAIDVPPFDRAAMDGYAVVAGDTFGASRDRVKTLRLVHTSYSGDAPAQAIASGECVEIATGAPLPDGADAVVMVEETEKTTEGVRIFTPVYPGQHVGRRAADISKGQTVVASGSVLNAGSIGALAAVGTTTIEVIARPRVAIVSTGNEIIEPGQPLGPGQIYNINRFTLTSIIETHGGTVSAVDTVVDTLADLVEAICRNAAADLIVFSGGSSVGERDLMLDAVRQTGEVIFHGIAVKPGKPTLLGKVGSTPVLGMPGNPTSCLSNAYLLVIPMLRQMARLPPYEPPTIHVPLARRIVSTTGRHQFFTVRVVDGSAIPAFKGSGDITSMAHADGYIEIPAQTDIVEAGEMVKVKLF
ncbi:MAG TPA: gephyrin-like molybdotransferase Glp [Vicinamibacterales bacterium]|nr:gephyrin-like molybdotransferase Glp [Vicinamibacterales bacterium]